MYAEVDRWHEGALSQMTRWVGAPLIKVENTRRGMDFEILSPFQDWWRGDVYWGEEWRHGASSREMVAWRRERSAIDATVTEVVSEASRLEVT